MKIGIDYTAAAHQNAGIGRYTRGLVAALACVDQENEYRLFVAGGGSQGGDRWPANVQQCTTVIPQHQLVRIWHRLRLPLPIEAFTGRVDVFYSPDFVLPPVWGGRTLLTVHDLSFARCPGTADPRLSRYLNVTVPRSVRRADHILADSQNTADDLMALWGVPPEKTSVLYPGVDRQFQKVRDLAQLARVRTQYDLPERFILAIGTLQPRKNYERLIQAFSRLRADAGDDTPGLVVIGSKGWLYQSIFEQAQESGLDGEIAFLGFVPDSDLPALYTLADLFAFPSLYEGFGLPVLEAMACGTPVVCSSASSLPEVAGDAAVMVDPMDVQGWADAMGQALADRELRRQLTERGLAQARKFGWADAAAKWITLCESLMS